MIKDERHSLCRYAFNRYRAACVMSLLLILFGVSETFAQPRGQRKPMKEVGEQAEKILERFWEIISGSLDSGPPPSLDDLEPIKRAFCKLFPDKCSGFPSAGTRVYRHGGIYSFPYQNSSAMFYNHEKHEAVSLPPRALSGIAKAAAYLEDQNWSSSQITSWLMPVLPHHYSRLEASGDCYVFKSRNGFVMIKYEGNEFTGKQVRIKIVSEKLPKKNPPPDENDRELELEPESIPAPLTLCSRFEDFKAYWEGSFDL